MTPNATLTIEFPNNTYKFPVEWISGYFTNGEDVAEQVFFGGNPTIDKDFFDGQPEMSVELDSNPKIKSQVFFEPETGAVYPVKDLANLKNKVKP